MSVSQPVQPPELKAKVLAAIDRATDELDAFAGDILRNPELGFREHRTAARVGEVFELLDLPMEQGLAITGVKATLRGARPGPTIAIMGELDALPTPGHIHADKRSGVAHSCGHHAQLVMLLGAAIGLVRSGVAEHLAGNIVFFAVPAEEPVEIDWRLELRAEGVIEFLGGKQELIRIGAFDDVDLAMMVHNFGNELPTKIALGGPNNGHVMKQAQFIGRGSHAGAAPERGINALSAARIALASIDAQRDTFRDSDAVRIHSIMTKGGDAVNIVPDDVRLETFVRARSADAIADANRKVDRALRAGAMALGATIKARTIAGYLPMNDDAFLAAVFRDNAEALLGASQVGGSMAHGAFVSDAGDLSHIMPVIQPVVGGGVGRPHGDDFEIVDSDLAMLVPARILAMSAIDLLANGAARASDVLKTAAPRFSKQQYLDFVGGMFYEEIFTGADR